jgi:transposase
VAQRKSEQAPDQQTRRELRRENERLRAENEKLQRENERLRGELEKAMRSAKRQAAPFSRGEPKKNPRKPGRKSGKRYGQRGTRPAPPKVDEIKSAPLPKRCGCGGCVQWERTEAQYQEDIECRTVWRRFDVEIGRCQSCQQRVQGRHAEQTSDALGAASVQIGPRALSLAAVMTKQMGLSLGRAGQLLEQGFGLRLHRSTLSRAMARLGRKAEPTYEQLLDQARHSVVNVMDETGWRVGGESHWAHVAVGEQATVYTIRRGRGYSEAVSLIGADYAGFLVRDGWAPYRKFTAAQHQSCLNHLMTRCREMEIAEPGAAGFPQRIRQALKKALQVRDRYGQGRISQRGLAIATGRMEKRLGRLLRRLPRGKENRKLAQHLRNEQPYLLTFLRCPGLAATNHQAEHALRYLVTARKTWGGNRTAPGARSQSVLLSVMRTCWQQQRPMVPVLMEMMRQRQPEAVELAAAESR